MNDMSEMKGETKARALNASRPARGKTSRRILMFSVPLLLAAAGAGYWLMTGRYETTDNAYLHQARLSVTSDLAGRVVRSGVADNMPVKAGDVLFVIDQEPYRIALEQADAAVASARLGVEQLKAAYRMALANEKAAETEEAYRQSELKRQQELSRKGVSASSSLDSARHDANKAHDALAAARQGVANTLAALGGKPDIATDQHPSVQSALAAREKAAYNLSLTTVRAPADGVLYQAASFRAGQFVAAGNPLFALVATGDFWVDANFKETQLAGIKPGESAEVEFDSYPGKTFKGRVAAIGAGTGAEFSLLPAQNATGNWVKVTQRVPVRIALDGTADMPELRSGLSASVTVDTGRKPLYATWLPGAFAAETDAGTGK